MRTAQNNCLSFQELAFSVAIKNALRSSHPSASISIPAGTPCKFSCALSCGRKGFKWPIWCTVTTWLTHWAGWGQADSCLPIFTYFALQGANFAFPRAKRPLRWKVSARLLKGLEASWEAAKGSEHFVPTKTSPARGLLDLTAWHHLSPSSRRNRKFLGRHIFIGSVWYLKTYKSYGSTLGFSKVSLSANNKVKPISTRPMDEIRYVFRSQAKSLLMLTGIPCLGMFVNLNSPPLLGFFNLPTSCLP